MVLEQFGEEKWREILETSGVPDDSFLVMRSYDDAITYKLAQAAADVLGVDLNEALRIFGVHWVERTVNHQYEMLAQSMGSNMTEFLSNVTSLHDRISSTFLNYRPPEFIVTPKDDGLVEVVYLSERVGLTPFVNGLLEGLSSRFNEPMEIIEQESLPVESGEQTRYLLRLS